MTRLIALAAVLTVVACFAPDNPICAFRCDDSAMNSGHCPDAYECRGDGYCHLKGSTEACPFPPLDMPMSVADTSSAPEMSAAPDMSIRPDMSGAPDMSATADMSSTSDGGVLIDLARPVDSYNMDLPPPRGD